MKVKELLPPNAVEQVIEKIEIFKARALSKDTEEIAKTFEKDFLGQCSRLFARCKKRRNFRQR